MLKEVEDLELSWKKIEAFLIAYEWSRWKYDETDSLDLLSKEWEGLSLAQLTRIELQKDWILLVFLTFWSKISLVFSGILKF
jgi:hypothetical protein